MSGRRQLDKALRRAARREQKRRRRMPVSGKNVLRLAHLIEQRQIKSRSRP